MILPPAVIVHGLGQVRDAVAPGRPVTLLSAWGAALYAGAGWWRALMAAAPGVPDILDCGDAPARALEALRLGQRRLVLRAAPDILEDVRTRAATIGAEVLAEAPAALDMAERGAARRLLDWLDGAAGSG